MSSKINAPLAGYVRVSRVAGREGESFHSPEEQRAAIERYAAAHGFELAHFDAELDVSGSKARRPVLDSILEGIKAGQLAGLVVFRLDRLSRLAPRDRVALFADVEDAGGVILSASEQLDASTPEGRFQRELFLGLARMQWERYRDGFDRAKAAAMERGAAIGPTPFGYARAADGSLVEHAEDGPALREAFRLAAREGLDAAHRHLAEHGGRTWTASTVRRLLGKTSYLGEHRYGSLRVKVPQLVTRATWEAAQPEPVKRRRPRADFPLSGLASCRSCGGPLVGARGGADGRRMYRCAAGLKTHRGPCCPAPAATSAEPLEALVRAQLVEALAAHPGYEGSEDRAGKLAAAEQALQEVEQERETFLASFASLARALGQEHAERQAVELGERVEHAQSAFREAAVGAEGQRVHVPAADVVAEAALEDLGGLLRGALDRVEVTKGRGRLEDRVRLVPKGSEAVAT